MTVNTEYDTRHIISVQSTVLEAIRRLNELSGGAMTLFVMDSDGRITGTLTDGDVRRALLAGVSLDASVSRAAHQGFKWLSADAPNPETLRSYRRDGLRLVPMLDSDGRLVRIIDTSVTTSILPLSAILMAGGKGERLRPLTLDCPKPLLPVGSRPIIDYNIQALKRAGITDINVTVNYLADCLSSYFAGTDADGVSVRCIAEPFAMGTIGSASLVPLPDQGDCVVMNADLLTTLSLEDMYLHHRATGADITVAAIPYNVAVPYAILTTEGSRVVSLEEKPSYSYYANAGVYIFPNRMLKSLSQTQRKDATDLIEEAIASGRTVSYWPINGLWLDIGSPADYRHACELMEHHSALG